MESLASERGRVFTLAFTLDGVGEFGLETVRRRRLLNRPPEGVQASWNSSSLRIREDI